MDVTVNEFSGKGLYDPGANASAINFSSLKKIKNYSFVPSSSTYSTTSGKGNIIGITVLNVEINSICSRVLLYVIDSSDFSYDFIIGLDLIPTFKLSLDAKLQLFQQTEKLSSQVYFVSNNINVNSSSLWNEYNSYDLFKEKVAHLSQENKVIIEKLINSNQSAFAKNSFDVGNVKNYECSLNLLSDRYVHKKPYRCSFEDQEEIERQCKELLKAGMITESSSPFATPVTLQYKKDGLSATKIKTRMCPDYRELNKILTPESFPFPLIDEILVKTRGCSWFSALDINAAFWSIPIRREDRYKSAFVTQHGHYEWRSMPFGLKNAPAVFQRVLSGIIRRRGLSKFCVNYLDDILIFSRTFEEHILHIQQLISAIFEEGFRLNFKKCNFAKSTIQYLGHIISPNSVTPLHDNVVAVKAFPAPSSRRSLRAFLGKINFYRKFIPHSSTLLEPFHRLLRKNVPFRWTHECDISFDEVKRLLTSSPVMAIFDRDRPITTYTDASGVGIGAVLKQIQDDGVEKPVAYFSRRLSDAQRKRKAIYIESLAIREAIRYWRFWLIGRHFTVVTDHKPLQHLNLKARPDEELGDLANELLQFDCVVLYRPGSLNHEADCLSRNPILHPSSETSISSPIIPSFQFLSLGEIRELQKCIVSQSNDVVNHDIIFRKIRNHLRIVITTQAGETLMRRIHSSYGHIGSRHMSLLLRPFWFPRMYSVIKLFCKNCSVCIKNKSRRSRRSARLGILGPATLPFQIMSLDTIGGFANNNSPKRYLHLLVDHFSRYAFILCSSGQSAKEMISLIDRVRKVHPIETLLTDQYGGLSSDEFHSYCQRSGINHVFSAVDSAFSNGLNERLGQTLVNRIRCLKHDSSTSSNKSWTTLAQESVRQYNETPHSVTLFPPSYLLTGEPVSLLPSSLCDPPNLVHDRQLALDRTLRSHDYNKKLYDVNKSEIVFCVGDRVYVDNGNKLNRDKLDVLRIGPYVITRKVSNNVFEIFVGGTGHLSTRLYHASKLILCNE